MNITSADITMVCRGVGENRTCRCEQGYSWPPSMCSDHLPCTVLSNRQICNCIENLTDDITGINCEKPKNTLYGRCKVNMPFTNHFLNSSSTAYRGIVRDFESALFGAYKKINGFLYVRISHIRKGSIIIGYEIKGDDISLSEVQDANWDVVSELGSKYDVNYDSFNVTDKGVDCIDTSLGYGFGAEGENAQILCVVGLEGIIDAVCKNGAWHIINDTCMYADLLHFQQANNASFIREHLPHVIWQLSDLVVNRSVPTTAGNLRTIVQILEEISNITSEADVTASAFQDFIETVNYVLDTVTVQNWTILLENEKDASSRLLQSVEKFAKQLHSQNSPPTICKPFIEIKAIEVNQNILQTGYSAVFMNTHFNVTGEVFIPKEQIQRLPLGSTLVSIAYPTLGKILPKHSNRNLLVNGLVMSVVVKEHMLINDVSLTFQKINNSLLQVNCVFWDFIVTSWNNHACFPENETDTAVVCRCSHLTSFSMLMSATTPSDVILSYIANIGLSISLGSLILCLIVEALVWRHVTKQTTSFMRHVCIVNISLSLLLADIWFIVAAINTEWAQKNGPSSNQKSSCISATFFIHFFYLSLFFWMLTLGLLIFYRTVLIFHELGRNRMMCIAFTIGYACPLFISVLTLIITGPTKGYIREDACWLNWDETQALLAFVLPALFAVSLNVMILVLVIIKVQRPTIGEVAPSEKNIVLQTGKRIAILSPILGLTWAIGFAIVAVDTPVLALHIIFSILNSLQNMIIKKEK
ncbi:adhesion G-protein coupled receptor F1-like [Pleurodeles waltl]|uniref:adhesion G-protein coupled receptor F1-like n=1 Tax=Pleurodeles waltl TaxID=8319 RepID=UPI00370970A0